MSNALVLVRTLLLSTSQLNVYRHTTNKKKRRRIVGNVVGFLILHFASKRRKFDGQVALGYMAWYGLGRCMIEGLRSDSLYIGPFRVSQLLAGVSCIIAVSILLWNHFRPHDPAKLYVNRVTEE